MIPHSGGAPAQTVSMPNQRSIGVDGARLLILTFPRPCKYTVAPNDELRAVYVQDGEIEFSTEEQKEPRVLAAGEGLRFPGGQTAIIHARRAESRAIMVCVSAPNPRTADDYGYFSVQGLPTDELRPGTERRSVPLGAGLLMFISYLRPTISPRHTHDHSSLIYVQQGEFAVGVGIESRVAVAGDGLVVQAGVPHGLRTQSPDARLIEVWYPFVLPSVSCRAAAS
jgi:quercetin dioxygenase-like cupin family protein